MRVGHAPRRLAGPPFRIRAVRASPKTGVLAVVLDVPTAGKLAFLATAKVPAGLVARQKKITVAKLRGPVSSAGTFGAKLKPSRAAMKVLRRTFRLKALLVVGYTPTGGTKATKRRAVTFKLARKR